MWPIVAISSVTILTNLISFAILFHLLPTLISICQCPPRLKVIFITTPKILIPKMGFSSAWDALGSSMSQVSRDKRSKNIFGASRPIRCTSQRAVGSAKTIPMWLGSMLSGRPTWPICRVLPGNTVKWDTFVQWLMCLSSVPRQFLSSLRTPKQSRRHSGTYWPPLTHATLNTYKPTRGRSFSTWISRS